MAQALLIGSSTADLENLFEQSQWALEREPGLAAAIRRLDRESFAAVLCDCADWKRTAAALDALEHPPILIALSRQNAKEDGVQAMAPNVYCVHVTGTARREIFSLLNHAWRVRNGER